MLLKFSPEHLIKIFSWKQGMTCWMHDQQQTRGYRGRKRDLAAHEALDTLDILCKFKRPKLTYKWCIKHGDTKRKAKDTVYGCKNCN